VRSLAVVRFGFGAASEDHLAGMVGLTGELLTRRAHQVGDGQLQRACLARALIGRPRDLICDEMTTTLDALTTAPLDDHRTGEGAGVLAISHDDALLEHWVDRIERPQWSVTVPSTALLAGLPTAVVRRRRQRACARSAARSVSSATVANPTRVSLAP
jgi:ABC-type dipeptide/oligopeptide/nickel transport system ATPase subunit